MAKKDLPSAPPALRARLEHLYNAALYFTTGSNALSPFTSDSKTNLQPDSAVASAPAPALPALPALPSGPTLNPEIGPSPGRAEGLSRHLSTQLQHLSRKTQTRLPRPLKRSLCRRCAGVLVEGVTAAARVENESGHAQPRGAPRSERGDVGEAEREGEVKEEMEEREMKEEIESRGIEMIKVPAPPKKPWADVHVTACRYCGAEKRFPVGMERLRRGWDGDGDATANYKDEHEQKQKQKVKVRVPAVTARAAIQARRKARKERRRVWREGRKG